MPGLSRPKDGVASLAYGAGHPRLWRRKDTTWMAATSPDYDAPSLGRYPEVSLARARTLALENRTNGDAAMTVADLVPGFLKSKPRRSADEVSVGSKST